MSETAGIEMHNAPIRAAEKQLITTEHHAYKITHDQSTSLPEEDCSMESQCRDLYHM